LRNFPRKQSQYADLYAEDIKKLFFICGDPKDIMVEVDGQNVFLQFASPGSNRSRQGALTLEECENLPHIDIKEINAMVNLTGEISHQVYFALRMARLPKLKLHVYSEEDAKAAYEALQAKKESEPARVRKECPISVSSLGIIKPPGLDTNVVQLEVVHFNHPRKFYVHYRSAELTRRLALIEQACAFACDDTNWPSKNRWRVCGSGERSEKLTKGCLYLAPFTDEVNHTLFYRARLEK